MKKKKHEPKIFIAEIRKKYGVWILFSIIFLAYLFLQLYQFSERAHWGWDQVDVAWNAKKILLDSDYPIFGMVAKGNTGFHIGPGYYYLASVFYKITDLHPIASPLLSLFSGVIGFFVLFFVTRKMFSDQIALIAVTISTFSYYILQFDKIQWPVNFIAPLSLLVFYSLYKILTGSYKHFLLLATVLGISLHVHFTCIFFFIFALLAMPCMPRKRSTVIYALASLPLFLIWMVPFFITANKGSNMGSQAGGYIATSYHGIHLTRVLQLVSDAFVEFRGILYFKVFSWVSFLFVPLFALVYVYKNKSKKRVLFCYLLALWFIIPWIAFATYSGEISNYYFSLGRPLAVIILSYLTYQVIRYKWYFAVLIIGFWFFYAFTNLQLYFKKPENEFALREKLAKNRMRKSDPIELHQNVPESYWHWYLKEYKKVTLD